MSDGAPRCCAGPRTDSAPSILASAVPAPERTVRRKRPVPFPWCAIPSGRFSMGSADAAGFAQDGEGPVREVTMRGFEVAAHL